MKSDYPDHQLRQDTQVLKQALHKLNATAIIISVVTIVVVAVIWWGLLNRLISFGTSLDYSGLEGLGVQNIARLKQYNPFFWWTIVALISLLIVYMLYQFCTNVFLRNRQKIVDETTIANLSRALSPAAKKVIFWIWQDPMHPITVGVLQRSLEEIKTGRFEKIHLAQLHIELLKKEYKRVDPEI